MNLDDIRERTTISVEEAGSILEVSRPTAYAGVRRYFETDGAEGIPAIKITPNRYRVPVALLLRQLGLDEAGTPTLDAGAPETDPAPSLNVRSLRGTG